MLRQHPLLFLISMLFLATLACNAFAGETEPALSVPPPIVTLEEGTAVPGNETPIADIAPTATLPGGSGTAVSTGSAYITILVDLNIRSGPGVAYDRLGFFLKDSTATVLGQDPASGWWLVACPGDIAAPQCWVSGGSQYSLGTNVGSVPIAAVPPTPTPVPTAVPTTEPAADTAVVSGDLTSYIVYSSTDGIWRLPLDMTQSPPTAGDPVLLAAIANVSKLLVSPDGQQVAFVAGTSESNRLGIVSAAGGSQILVESTALPNSAGGDFSVLINQIEWLPNSQSIAFNTRIVHLIGPGAAPQSDLWTVTTSGSLTEKFALDSGGHTFALSPDGTRVIFGNPESVTRVNMDGSNRETVIQFPFVNTASEYAWVPTAQWLPSGSLAYIAIADNDPWSPDAEATLYQIPVSGPTVTIGSVLGNTLFSPVHWTSNGSRLAYLQIIVNSDNLRSVAVADGAGDNASTYITGNAQLEFTGWNKAGTHFLYYGSNFLGIGQLNQSPIEALISGSVRQQMWLSDSAFVTAVGSSGNWDLLTGNLSGNTQIVAETFSPVQFDVWVP